MPPNSNAPKFPSTHWSLVELAQGRDAEEAQRALESLCERYWYPIYAYLRRSGRRSQDAEDLTQAFFQRVVAENAFGSANEDLGRLRSYLLGVLKRVLSDEQRHRAALKRGGGRALISFEETAAEDRYRLEPTDLESPDRLFDRAWARDLLANASVRLRATFAEGDNASAYDHLAEFLPLGANTSSYREVAARMEVKESAVRLQVHRMRKRYRDLIEEEIALTVGEDDEVDSELNYLMEALGS